MSVDILHENRVTLTQLASREKIHPSTVWRWVLRGCRGVKLESSLIGGKRVTSQEAFARFVARLNAPLGEQAPTRTAAQRQRAADRAKAELARNGI